MASTFDMNLRFTEALNALLQEKSRNSGLLTKEKYRSVIEDVKQAKIAHKKAPVDYRRLKRYDIITVDGKEKLVVPITGDSSSLLYFVHTEQLFDLLHSTHLKIGHGGRTRMEMELKTKYKNITKEVIMLYLRLCKKCQAKLSSNPKKDQASKSLLCKQLSARCQADVIDMQSNPDGEYKFILNYQDLFTKFRLLRPLRSETAEEVANQLLDIFTTIGFPTVLQSENGREFANQVIYELKNKWSDLKLEYGILRYSQSQGYVEDANQDLQNMMMTWMQTNGSTHWAESLRFIQFMKNHSFHQDIHQSPFEAMFGYKAETEPSTLDMSKDVVDNLVTGEEDLGNDEMNEQEMEDAANSESTSVNETAVEDKYENVPSPPALTASCARCNCGTKCKTNRCKCRNSKLLCNSECHNNSSCCNK